MHVLGLDRPLFDDALHLSDDKAAIVMRRHRLGEVVEHQRLFLHADIAGGIGRGAANESDVDLGGDIEQPLFAVDVVIFDDVFGGHVIDAAAAEALVDISVEADLGEQSRLAGGAGAVKLGDHALRQIIAEDLVLLRRLGDLRHTAEIGGDDATQQTFVIEAAGAQPLTVAGAGGHDQRQIARMLGLDKALLQRRMQRFGNAALHETCRRHHVIVANKRNRLIGADHLVGHFPGFP